VSKLIEVLEEKSASLENENGDGRLAMEDIVAAAEVIMKEMCSKDERSKKENDKKDVANCHDIWKTTNKQTCVIKINGEDSQIMDEAALINENNENKDDEYQGTTQQKEDRNDVVNFCKDVTNIHKACGPKDVGKDDKIKAIQLGTPIGYKGPGLRHWTSFKVSGKNVRKMTYSQYRGMLDSYARRRQEEVDTCGRMGEGKVEK
jgi:hypothetical protein